MNKKNTVYLGLGSNKGDKLKNIRTALSLIEEINSTNIEILSSIYLTRPFGFLAQDDFLNAVIKISTDKNIGQLFIELQKIEKELGRKKTVKWGPRIIDIDILFFNDELYSDNGINVPHKGIVERDFVLVPLAEIEPDLVHPALNVKITDICNAVSKKQIICKIENTKLMSLID